MKTNELRRLADSLRGQDRLVHADELVRVIDAICTAQPTVTPDLSSATPGEIAALEKSAGNALGMPGFEADPNKNAAETKPAAEQAAAAKKAKAEAKRAAAAAKANSTN